MERTPREKGYDEMTAAIEPQRATEDRPIIDESFHLRLETGEKRWIPWDETERAKVYQAMRHMKNHEGESDELEIELTSSCLRGYAEKRGFAVDASYRGLAAVQQHIEMMRDPQAAAYRTPLFADAVRWAGNYTEAYESMAAAEAELDETAKTEYLPQEGIILTENEGMDSAKWDCQVMIAVKLLALQERFAEEALPEEARVVFFEQLAAVVQKFLYHQITDAYRLEDFSPQVLERQYHELASGHSAEQTGEANGLAFELAAIKQEKPDLFERLRRETELLLPKLTAEEYADELREKIEQQGLAAEFIAAEEVVRRHEREARSWLHHQRRLRESGEEEENLPEEVLPEAALSAESLLEENMPEEKMLGEGEPVAPEEPLLPEIETVSLKEWVPESVTAAEFDSLTKDGAGEMLELAAEEQLADEEEQEVPHRNRAVIPWTTCEYVYLVDWFLHREAEADISAEIQGISERLIRYQQQKTGFDEAVQENRSPAQVGERVFTMTLLQHGESWQQSGATRKEAELFSQGAGEEPLFQQLAVLARNIIG